MKAYADLNQSKVLAYILPHDTADQTYERFVIAGENLDVPEEMLYKHNGDVPFKFYSGVGLPCWSLAALLKLIPNFNMFKRTIECRIETTNHLIDKACEPIDAAFEMICWMKENNKI